MFTALYGIVMFFYYKTYHLQKNKYESLWASILSIGTFLIFYFSHGWLAILGQRPRGSGRITATDVQNQPSFINDPNLPLAFGEALIIAVILGTLFYAFLRFTKPGSKTTFTATFFSIIFFIILIMILKIFVAI